MESSNIELSAIQTPKLDKQKVKELKQDLRHLNEIMMTQQLSHVEEPPPPEGVDRPQIIEQAAKDIFDEFGHFLNKRQIDYLRKCQGVVMFLTDKDYREKYNSYAAVNPVHNGEVASIYYKENGDPVICVNNDKIMTTVDKYKKRVNTEDSTPIDYDNFPSTFINLIRKWSRGEDYEEDRPENNEPNNETAKKIYENYARAAVFHEMLHAVAENNFDRELDENATHFLTAAVALKKGGIAKFGFFGKRIFQDANRIKNFYQFVKKHFKNPVGIVSFETAKEMYFNGSGSWTKEKVAEKCGIK